MNVGNGDGVGVWSRSTALHCVINLLEESGAEGNKKVEDVVSCVGYYPSRSRYTDVCSCWECCWHCQHVLFLKTLREFYEGNWKSISSLSGFFFFFFCRRAHMIHVHRGKRRCPPSKYEHQAVFPFRQKFPNKKSQLIT